MVAQIEDFTAEIRPLDIAGVKWELTVTGVVEVTNTNENPTLTRAVPQGTNPAILILVLTIESDGIGNTVITRKPVSYKETFDKDPQPKQVEIRDVGVLDIKTTVVSFQG